MPHHEGTIQGAHIGHLSFGLSCGPGQLHPMAAQEPRGGRYRAHLAWPSMQNNPPHGMPNPVPTRTRQYQRTCCSIPSAGKTAPRPPWPVSPAFLVYPSLLNSLAHHPRYRFASPWNVLCTHHGSPARRASVDFSFYPGRKLVPAVVAVRKYRFGDDYYFSHVIVMQILHKYPN